jgi:outer membrane protein W
LSLALSCALVPSLRARADDADFARRGAYVGIGASRGFNSFGEAVHDATNTTSIDVEDTWGLNARAGYRFAKWFALEGEYEWLDGFPVRFQTTDLAEITTHTLTVNARFIVPLGRVQPYFVMGFGGIFFDTNNQTFLHFSADDAPCGRLGAGVDFYVTRNLLLNLGAEGVLNDAKIELAGPFGDSGHGLDYVALQFGLGFRF